MAKISSSVTVTAPAERVFRVITDPALVVKLIPGAMRVTRVPRLPLVRGSEVHWEFMLLGMPLRGRWVVDEISAPLIYIARTVGGVDGRLIYSIVPRGKSCRLTLDFDYRPPASVVRRYALRFVEPHAQNIVDSYLASLKAYVETEKRG